MPTSLEAIQFCQEKDILFGPAKAANAGGVATSGLEMTQNSMRVYWSRKDVEKRLHKIMINIHKICLDAAEEMGDPGNYLRVSNIDLVKKVAD